MRSFFQQDRDADFCFFEERSVSATEQKSNLENEQVNIIAFALNNAQQSTLSSKYTLLPN